MTLDIVPLQTERRMLVGEELRLQFRLFDADNRKPPDDLGPLRALVFHPGDGWQGQCWAHPMGNGLYEVRFPTPGAGSCYLFLACPKSGDGYAELPYLILQTSDAGTTAIGRTPETAAAVHQC